MPEFSAILLATTVTLSALLGDVKNTSEGISFVLPGAAPEMHPTMELEVFTANHGAWCALGPVRPAQAAWLQQSLKSLGYRHSATIPADHSALPPKTCLWDPSTSGPDLTLFGRTKNSEAYLRNKPPGSGAETPSEREQFLSTFDGDGFYLDDPTECQTEQSMARLWTLVHPSGAEGMSTRTAVKARYAYGRVAQYHRHDYLLANTAFEEALTLAMADDACLDLLPAIRYGVVDSLLDVALSNSLGERTQTVYFDMLGRAKEFLPTGDPKIDSEILGHVGYAHVQTENAGKAARVFAHLRQQYPGHGKPLISTAWHLAMKIKDRDKTSAIELLDSILETTASVHNLQILRGQMNECNNHYSSAARWRAYYAGHQSGTSELGDWIMNEKIWREVRLHRQLDILLAKRMGLVPEDFSEE